jgi:hypothetical protein
LQDPPKFTQIGIFGLKICHLATVPDTRNSDELLKPQAKLAFNEVAADSIRAAQPSF